MKKLLLIAAVSVAATSAFASKARITSLQNAAHLLDIQDVTFRPDQATAHGEFVTVEFGSTAGATTNAEGGFVRKAGDSAWGLYLGGTNATVTNQRALLSSGVAALTGYTAQENPLRLFYGTKTSDMSWGAGLFYSNSDKKSAIAKQTATALSGSMTMGAFDANLNLVLGNTVQREVTSVTTKVTGATTMSLSAGYWMDSLYFSGNYAMGGAKREVGSTTSANWDTSSITLSVIDSVKKDAVDFFYGASYKMDSAKQKEGTSTKAEISMLPVIVGIEADAANWLTFRASITQNVLLGSNKNDTGLTIGSSTDTTLNSNGETNTIADNTTVSAGIGMKWNKFIVDGVITNSGNNGGAFGLDSAGFVNRVSMTYMF